MTTVTVTNQIPTGSGFGVNDSGENVFIPAHIMLRHELAVEQRFEALLADNDPEMQHKTRWRVALVVDGGSTQSPEPKPEPKQPSVSLDEAIVKVLKGGDLWSTRDVVQYLLGDDYDTTSKQYFDISNTLQRLHSEGRIAAAAVRPISSQGRASFYLWACDVDAFR